MDARSMFTFRLRSTVRFGFWMSALACTVKNNEILVVLDESVSSVDRELAGNGGKSENIDGTDVSENGSTDVAEEDWAGLD